MKFIYFLLASFLFTSCASILLPRNQTVTFNTHDKDATVYVDNVKIGKGATVTKRIKKDYSQQVVVQSPNKKDVNYCMLVEKRPAAYYPLAVMSYATFYGLYLEGMAANTFVYPNTINIPEAPSLVKRTDKNKYIELEAIKLDVKDVEKDIQVIKVDLSAHNDPAELKRQEKEIMDGKKEAEEKKVARENKKKASGGELELLNDNKSLNEIKLDNTKFSIDIEKSLVETGFVDTINRVFLDNNNTLKLQGVITKFTFYRIGKMFIGGFEGCYKTKLYLTWYIKNDYGEIIDSVLSEEFSGEFVKSDFEDLFSDALESSYLRLHENPKFQEYLKFSDVFEAPEENLTLHHKNKYLRETSEANEATVIVKNGKSHGSGFAITPDGYILTNYHVISSEYVDKFDSLSVVLSNGEEFPATIIRHNRSRDIALIKIEHNFDRVFKLPTEKKYKNMQDVYTIGAPKSIELGQSISTGIISSERKVNNNDLIQLNMSVNGGNSGGPVFDKQANLHGVIVSKLFGFSTEGICFSIPAHKILEYLNLTIIK